MILDSLPRKSVARALLASSSALLLVLACVDKEDVGGREVNVVGVEASAFQTYVAQSSDPAFLQTGSWCKSTKTAEGASNHHFTTWLDSGSEGTSTVLNGSLHKTGALAGYTDEVAASGGFTLGETSAFGDVACGSDVDSDGTFAANESCEGSWSVLIELDQGGSCSDPTNTKLTLNGQTTDSFRMTDPDATCTAGSGRFVLIPTYVGDHDADGYLHGVYFAAQESGAGTMTNHAWVTEIDVVDDDGIDVSVVHADELIGFDDDDVLENVSSISTALSGTHTFSSGTVSGHPGFVLADIPSADDPEVTVGAAPLA